MACLALGGMLLAGLVLLGCEGDRGSEPTVAPPSRLEEDPGRGAAGADCDADRVLAEFALDAGRVDILDVNVDPEAGEIAIWTRWPDDGVCRQITLRPDFEENGWKGFTAQNAHEEDLHFGVGLRWSTNEPGRLRVSEWNEADHLDIEMAPLASGIVREHYVWNGLARTFDRGPEPLERADLGKRNEWREFYPGSSLESNVEGERLVQLVMSEDFVRWLDVRLGGRGDAIERADDIGDWLTICAALKCSIFGIANPVCHACFGASLAIAIGNILCELVVQCD